MPTTPKYRVRFLTYVPFGAQIRSPKYSLPILDATINMPVGDVPTCSVKMSGAAAGLYPDDLEIKAQHYINGDWTDIPGADFVIDTTNDDDVDPAAVQTYSGTQIVAWAMGRAPLEPVVARTVSNVDSISAKNYTGITSSGAGFTKAGHGYDVDDILLVVNPGNLKGIKKGSKYWVVAVPDANHFRLGRIKGGDGIVVGTGSGISLSLVRDRIFAPGHGFADFQVVTVLDRGGADGITEGQQYSITRWSANGFGLASQPGGQAIAMGAVVNMDLRSQIDGERRFNVKTPGAIMKAFIDEQIGLGMAPIAYDFGSTVDSDGNAWPKTYSLGVAPGVTLIDLLKRLQSSGWATFSFEGRKLRMFPKIGTDRSIQPGAVRIGRYAESRVMTRTINNMLTEIISISTNGKRVTREGVLIGDSPYGRLAGLQTLQGVNEPGTSADLTSNRLAIATDPSIQYTISEKGAVAEAIPHRDYFPGDNVQSLRRGRWTKYGVSEIQWRVDAKGIPTIDTLLGGRFTSLLARVSSKVRAGGGGMIVGGNGTVLPFRNTMKPSPPLTVAAETSATWAGTKAVPQLTASWDPVTTDVEGNSVAVADYEVWVRAQDANDSAPVKRTGGDTAVTLAIAGEVGASTIMKVRPLSVDGEWGAFSDEIEIPNVLPEELLEVPTAPTVTSDAGQIIVEWDGRLVGPDGPEAPGAQIAYVGAKVSATVGGTYTPRSTTLQQLGRIIIAGDDIVVGDHLFVSIYAVDNQGQESPATGPIEVEVLGTAYDSLAQDAQDAITDALNAGNAANAAAAAAQIDADAAQASATAAQTAANAAAAAADTAAIAAGFTTDPGFEKWGATPASPAFYAQLNASKPALPETAIVRSGLGAAHITAAGGSSSANNTGLVLNPTDFHGMAAGEYITVALDFYLVSGSLSDIGFIVEWVGMGGTNKTFVTLQSIIGIAPIFNTWYHVSKVIRRPSGTSGAQTGWRVTLAGTIDFDGFVIAGEIIADNWVVRPSTTEEVTAIQAAADAATAAANASTAIANASAALTAANGKNKNIYSAFAASGTTGYVAGDLWWQVTGGVVVGQWQFNGASWAAQTIGNAVIAQLDAAKITTGLLDANRIGANTITVNKLLVGDFTQLVADGTFDDPTGIGYTYYPDSTWGPGNTQWTVDTSRPHTGTRSAKFTLPAWPSGTRPGLFAANLGAPFLLKVGDQFYYEYWVYNGSSIARNAPSLGVTAVNADGSANYGTEYMPNILITPGVWTKVSGFLNFANSAYASAAKGIPTFVTWSDVQQLGDAAYSWWFDDMILRRANTGQLLVDGGVTKTSLAADVQQGLYPVGASIEYYGRDVPDGFLAENGQAVSRTTYAALFAKLCPTISGVAVNISGTGGGLFATVTLNGHGFPINGPIKFSTTGALPTGITAGTTYYVSATNYAADTFGISATPGGTRIQTSGTQSGVHSIQSFPHGLGNGSTTFNVPDSQGMFTVATKPGDANFGGAGRKGGSVTHSHTLSDAGQAQYTMTATGNHLTRQVGANTWTPTVRSGTSTPNTTLTAQTVGAGLQGVTDDATALPPYIGLNRAIKF